MSKNPSHTKLYWRVVVIALVLSLALGSAGQSARAAASSARGPGVATYTVIPAPAGPITLCPGQTKQIAVRVSKQVTRTVRGQAVVGRPMDIPRANVGAQSGDASIAIVTPDRSQSVRLQASSGAQTSHLGAWFAVTAQKLGDTNITFSTIGLTNPGALPIVTGSGLDDLTALGNFPTAQVLVHVKCQFKVTLSAAWVIPGEATINASFVLSDVGLAPDADGNFQVEATVPNRTVRHAPACGGFATVSPTKAHFSGNVSPDGLLHIEVTFDPVPHTGGEGCVGKTVSGSAQPAPLIFTVNISTGQRWFFLQLPQILQDDGAAFNGTTYVYINVLQP